MNLPLLRSVLQLPTRDVFAFATARLGTPDDTGKLYHYWAGDIPVCLVAHIDTVHRKPPKPLVLDAGAGVAWAPNGLGADDRAGVYGILELCRRGARPHVLLTDEEETGCKGARQVIDYLDAPDVRVLIQMDRRNRNDCVYYDCDSAPLKDYIAQYGFKEAQGSFSDISVVAPDWGIAAVNLSCGYYNEHTCEERLHINELAHTVDRVGAMLASPPVEALPYVECERYSYSKADEEVIAYLKSKQKGLGFDQKTGKLSDGSMDWDSAFPETERELWAEYENEFNQYLNRDEEDPRDESRR